MNNMYTSNISHFFLYRQLPAVVACNVADGNDAVAITGVVVNAVSNCHNCCCSFGWLV